MNKIEKKFILGIGIVLALSILSCSRNQSSSEEKILKPADYGSVWMDGELALRADRNFTRLETGRFIPDSIYKIPSEEYHYDVWPGDLPGRLILGHTLLQRSTGREGKYLEHIINDLPSHLNDLGYMGKIYEDHLNEQQLSGHGWLLRGLCEYYIMTGSQEVLDQLKAIEKGLVLPTKGAHKNYPILPSLREEAGSYMGTHTKELSGWILSSDVGCDFIFMDGVIQLYDILRTPELKEIVYEMAGRYMETDLLGIKAQTHASLTGMRGLVRLFEITGEDRFLEGAAERYKIYKEQGMTENYENYNWFGRPDTWTEPCAVIDSYLLMLKLWEHTGITGYLEDAQMTWYNAIAYEQRDNGGFGLSNCCGPLNRIDVSTQLYEAHWCCTMRGAEGIATKIRSSYFTQGNTVIIADFQPSRAQLNLSNGTITIKQETRYPFNDQVNFTITEEKLKGKTRLKLFIPKWIEEVQLSKSGIEITPQIEDGFLIIEDKLKAGDSFSLNFKQKLGKTPTFGVHTSPGFYKVHYGPLLLGAENPEDTVILPGQVSLRRISENQFAVEGTKVILTPVYHLMEAKVGAKDKYHIQIMFR